MGTKTKSFLSAVALGFAVLFFGPATSSADAEHHRYARHQRHHRSYYGHRSIRPYYGPSHFRHHRPYRLVRVFVYDPFPRWVYRRVYSAPPVYYAPPVYGSYRSPY
jgi:hypothetical protein